MRLRSLFVACVIASAAWGAQAQTGAEEASARFLDEIGRQCPDKQLQMLSSRDLRDGLDNYMDGLPTDARAALQKSETAGAACVNMADILAADQLGRVPELAGSLCVTFLRCRSQGDCDYAR